MNILITGGTGLIGTALKLYFEKANHHVFFLTRKRKQGHAYWDIKKQIIEYNSVPNPDVIINLSGENISNKRWSKRQKKKIINSRVLSTRLLISTINASSHKPQLVISGSAIGFYGNRGSDWLSETSEPVNEFASDICQQWEQTSQKLDKSIRLVNIRTGIVLSRNGGALKKLLFPFKIGLGGIMGTGHQYLSWISIDDVVNAIDFIIQNNDIYGPVNLCSPNPVTNAKFSKQLAALLQRPMLLPMPAWLVRMLFGEMGEALLLSSSRVQPAVLLKHGFIFKHTTLKQALEDILNAPLTVD